MQAAILFYYGVLCFNVGNNSFSYLKKCLRRISDQQIAEQSRCDPLFESSDHDVFIIRLESYHKRPESIQIILQWLFLPLPYVEKVIQLRRFDLVDRELFSKQSGELSERGDVTIGKPTNPL